MALPVETDPTHVQASSRRSEPKVGQLIRVSGTVQGVGFRPMVYRLAKALGLGGEVGNDGQGVLIRLWGAQTQIDQLMAALLEHLPPLARVTQIESQPLRWQPADSSQFRIVDSQLTPVNTSITADGATCGDCLAEVFDSQSRFFHYPFTTCTHCGPRLSIIVQLPYDRPHTAMAGFPLCAACRADYKNPEQRRFHAQPIACPVCGPQVWLEAASDGSAVVASATSEGISGVLAQLLDQLLAGEIVAIKGLGGVHLAADATNSAALRQLRQAKGRRHKPFAVMARDVAAIIPYCQVSPQEAALLTSPAAPIVLLTRNQTSPPGSHPALAADLAPGLARLGVMLPHTPLHHLIFHHLDRPLVMTSGNYQGRPQCIDNQAAREQLGSIARYFLLHNRGIVNRVEDSVVQVTAGRVEVLRRSRGYAPTPLALPAGFYSAPAVLALGSQLKATFCLIRAGQATLSPHLGDLDNSAIYQDYQQTLQRYLQVLQYQPQELAVDHHPDYLSTKLGQDWGDRQSLAVTRVQHHHAHIAACLADNGLPLLSAPVLGIALDGLGYGEAGQLWGGEFLLADYRHYRRLAYLKPIPLLGGSQAIRQPWRSTYAHLVTALGGWPRLKAAFADLPLVAFLDRQPRSLLDTLLTQGLHCPLSSSAGRLFDAVAAALGICQQEVSYEGQAAMELAAQVSPADLAAVGGTGYRFRVGRAVPGADPEAYPLVVDPTPLWWALLKDLQRQTPLGLMAARFHLGLAEAIAGLAVQLARQQHLTTVALSGGVWQNQLLLNQVRQQLQAAGLTVLSHSQVPANDGGLSLGQALVAAAQRLSPLVP
ncbi:MAG: carbamoyltransferase HypF [Cyanobacteria bacterium REEB459]|nr:carbamoyltransferase HypF [Cyanobacteria bacterium REEB459]